MKFVMKLSVIFHSILLTWGSVAADEVTGEFNFTRLPPHAAVVYVPDENAPKRIAQVDQKNIKFTKTLDVGTSGTNVIFSNSDRHVHYLFASN